MDMIRHDDKVTEVVTRAIAITQILRHDPRQLRILQRALAFATVEILHERARERLMILPLRVGHRAQRGLPTVDTRIESVLL